MKHSWEQIHDMWNACGYDEILKKQYKDEMVNLPNTIKQLENEEPVRDENGEGYVRRIYIGSVCSLFPSGKFYMPWTSNQNHRDVYKDEIFREVLEEMLEEEDCTLENGEGSADDLFICKYYDDPFESFDRPEKARALASFLELEFNSWDDIKEESEKEYKYGREYYSILTESEADDEMDDYIRYYIDDVVLNEIPEHLRMYFDVNHYKSDIESDFDRGNCLASYDGNENDGQDPESKEYFLIYRTN